MLSGLIIIPSIQVLWTSYLIDGEEWERKRRQDAADKLVCLKELYAHKFET